MAKILWTSVLLLSAQLVASQGSGQCGRPVSYPDKRLDEKYAQLSEFKNGDRVAYKCAVGHRQTAGSRVSFCRNGQWEPLNMKCIRKWCGSAGEIEFGRYVQQGNSFGDKATAECDDGYVLEGERVRECLDNGWSGTIPSCRKVSHSSPPLAHSPLGRSPSPGSDTPKGKRRCQHPKITNAKINGTKNKYDPGESLSISCNVGHQLTDNITITRCQMGRWTPQLKCELIKCPKLVILNGGVNDSRVRINMTVKITCEDGFQLKGAELITCAANRSWAPAVPTCESGKCGRFPDHPDAMPRQEYLREGEYEPDDYVRFKCNPGYRWAGGNSSIRCDNGRWTPLEMRCEKINCGSAGEIANGRIQYTGVSFGDTATAECFEGYRLVGVGVRRCGAEGWDGRVPVCEAIRCPTPTVANSRMQEGRDYGVGERMTIVCQESFNLIGSPQITCGPNGQWQALPECRSATGKCSRLPHHPDAMPRQEYLRKGEYEPDDYVRFKCNPGYRWAGGSSSIRCKNGHWTSLEMRCERKPCGSAGEIANGRFQYTGVSFGDTATAECFEGYRLVGFGVRRCRAEGWDGRTPVCEVVKCPSPPEVPGAEIFDTTDGHAEYGHVVSYRCRSGSLIGAQDIYCTEHGTWSAPPPRCQVWIKDFWI
ncbi:sushi, von Willebrand factor type A, EGF and pentraxin domain-containing protein 1 isoform X2 [Colossoma macropomum]|uniref:sushi, von Willebrand factor type A, EGF and pentraxin domain-containing protein 1 isoform X2 n=1 Tax=Colossoma macropomum TaxID=42526 RepID=UPI0018647EBA|nr:sushi, von Willebrand factor type A, EGF and pentraxin domain-containing protein 1 isoform X2 [Colossoma macropomum]